MGKYYIVEGAELTCRYGSKTCKLKPASDRHIGNDKGKRLANIADIYEKNLEGNFGTCCSPYGIEFRGLNQSIESIHELNPLIKQMGGEVCACKPVLAPWQDGKEDVQIGIEGYPALVEEGWTWCLTAKGIVTMVDSGQGEEKKMLLLRKLDQLEAVVREYGEQNNLSEAQIQDILTNQLMHHGYSPQAKVWEVTSDPECRQFAAYMEEKEPALSAWFERGLYVEDCQGEIIDLTYAVGAAEALHQGKEYYDLLNPELLGDQGMLNAYLEVGRQPRGPSSIELVRGIIQQSSVPEENPYERYEQFYQRSAQVQFTQKTHADILSTQVPTMEQLEEAAQGSVDEEKLLEKISAGMTANTLVDQQGQLITENQVRQELGNRYGKDFLALIKQKCQGGE